MYKRALVLLAVCLAVTVGAFIATPQRATASPKVQYCYVSPAANEYVAGSYSFYSVYGNGGTFCNLGCTYTAVGLFVGSTSLVTAGGCNAWENQYTVSYPCTVGHSPRTWTTQQGSFDGGRSSVSQQLNC